MSNPTASEVIAKALAAPLPDAISKASSRPARTADVMAASNATVLEPGGIADNDHASSSPSPCSKRYQDLIDRMVMKAV